MNYHHQYFCESSLCTLSLDTTLNVVALMVQKQCFMEYSIKRVEKRKVLLYRVLQAWFLPICIECSIAPEPLELMKEYTKSYQKSINDDSLFIVKLLKKWSKSDAFLLSHVVVKAHI